MLDVWAKKNTKKENVDDESRETLATPNSTITIITWTVIIFCSYFLQILQADEQFKRFQKGLKFWNIALFTPHTT